MPTAASTCLLVAAAILATVSVPVAVGVCVGVAIYEFLLPYVARG